MELEVAFPVLGLLLIMVFAGVHIAIALAVTSLLGLYLVTDSWDITINTLARTSLRACAAIFLRRCRCLC